jgi:penicillin-insensitive murein endopeptidase
MARMRFLLAALAPLFLGAAEPHSGPTLCSGTPSDGTLRDGHLLSPRPFLRIKRGSELRTWGHAVLLQLVDRGARAAALAVPGSEALVGDLSAQGGGPLSGHVSHQAGRDADVGFFVSDSQGRPVALDAFEAFDADGRSASNPDHHFDAYRNWLMLRSWLSDLRVVVTYVFISPELCELLLEYGRQSPEFARYVPLAAQVLHPYPHHADHFHLRIACPSDQGAACRDGRGSRDE